MKRTIVAVLIGFTCFGCALTPKSVLRSGDMAVDGIDVIQQNVFAVIDGYVDKTNEAYTQGLMAWFNQQVAQLTDSEGRVDISSYNRLAASLAQRMAQNRQLLEAESEVIMVKLAQQFAIVRNFQYLVNEYNLAAGIPPETMEALISATIGILDDIAAARAAKEPASTSGSSVSQIDWAAMIERIGRAEYANILESLRTVVSTTEIE